MKLSLTDREILRAIYDTYLPKFAGFDRKNPDREVVNYVPIDVDHVGSKLGSDGDMIYGRLFFHMNRQHGYRNDTKVRLPFLVVSTFGANRSGEEGERAVGGRLRHRICRL